MNKKFLFRMFAAVSMLFATSCSNDEFDAVQNGNEATVTFTAQLPDGLQTKTRAFGDGTTATNLSCFVYDENWTYIAPLSKENVTTMSGLKAKISLKLVNGETYHVVFWADASDAPYTFNESSGSVNMNYNDAPANAENRDAFVWVEKITANGDLVKTIKLYRPFAQINIGTTDWADVELNKNVTIKNTSISVATYSTFNFNGKTTADEKNTTFALAAMPTAAETFPKKDVGVDKYLSMNYILVNADKELVDVTINYDGGVQSRTFANVPVQRNYRTNIYGKLLTSTQDYNVEIVPGFDGEHNYGADPKPVEGATNTYEVSTAAGMMQIATIIANTKPNEAKPLSFRLAADIDMSGLEWTPMAAHWVNFDGQGHTISNLNCGTDATAKSGFCGYFGASTIKNLTLHNVTATGEQAGIIAGQAEPGTFENVTISGTNYVTYKDTEYNESWGGVGAIFGVNTGGERTVGVTIETGATIYVDKDGMTTQSPVGNDYAMITGVTVSDNGNVLEKVEDGVYSNNEIYNISSASGLYWFAEQTLDNKGKMFANKTLNIVSDIDLNGKNWTPINMWNAANFIFDGNDHTISNMTAINDLGYGNGFFSNLVGKQTVKNVTFDKATVMRTSEKGRYSGNMYGIVSGYAYGTVNFENVHITNSYVEGYGKVAALVGMAADPNGVTTLKGCSVTKTEVAGVYNVAGLIGLVQNEMDIKDCVSEATWKASPAENYVDLNTTAKYTKNGEEKTIEVNGKYWLYSTYYYAGWSKYYSDLYYSDAELATGGQLADGLCHN